MKKKQQQAIGIYRTSVSFNFKMMLLYSYMIFLPIELLFGYKKIMAHPIDYSLTEVLNHYIIFLVLMSFMMMVLTVIYSVTIYGDHIRGYTQNGKKICSDWRDIKTIKIQTFWPCKYIELLNNNDETLMVIPYKGLSKYDDFKKSVNMSAVPSHILSEFLNQD